MLKSEQVLEEFSEEIQKNSFIFLNSIPSACFRIKSRLVSSITILINCKYIKYELEKHLNLKQREYSVSRHLEY